MKHIKTKCLESIDLNKYEVRTSDDIDKVSITIIRKMQKCDICESTKHYRTLAIRQDSRVKFFMVSRKVCRNCIKDVDIILNNLKDSVQSPLKTGRW